MRKRIAALALIVTACGGGGTTTTTPTTIPATTTAATTSTTAAASMPSVLAIVSGRGDDGSLEVSVWFDTDPFAAGATLIVGFDADDSYTGVGDVLSHLDGFALFTPTNAGVDLTVNAEGEVVAGPGLGVTDRWVSWGSEGDILRIFFVRDVTTRAGTVWVMASVGDTASALGVAGVLLGESCSHAGSGVAVVEPPGGVPDAGRTCTYR
jgi:hypothetical protein